MNIKKTKIILGIFCMMHCFFGHTNAQDPGFSQYMASPLTISPALTGNSEAAWRISSVFRNQSTGIGSPYVTKTLSVEGMIRNQYNDNYWGVGGMVLLDAAMDGIYKSTYVSLNAAYHLSLDENGNGLAAGLGYINNRTFINFSDLTFDQQLSNMGFNRALPQGEPSLANNPSFSSVCAGLMYSYTSTSTYANFGLAGYRFIKSKKSILDDATQYDSPRYDVHADFSTILNEKLNLSLTGVHMIQNGSSTTVLGGIFGFVHKPSVDVDVEKILNLGVFYRLGNAMIPYAGYEYKNFQVGLTYDINTSSKSGAAIKPQTFEISLIYKHYHPDIPKPGRYHSPY